MVRSKIDALVALADADTAAAVARVLIHRNINVSLQVSCTYEAVNAMVDQQFQLFVLDALIPMKQDRPNIHGGIDFIRFLRMCEGVASEAVAVFVRSPLSRVTSIEAQDEIGAAREAGADCIVTRPLTLEKFDRVVAPLLAARTNIAEEPLLSDGPVSKTLQ